MAYDIMEFGPNANNGWRKSMGMLAPRDTEFLEAGDLSEVRIEETRQGSRLYVLRALRYTGDPRAYWSSESLPNEPMKKVDALRTAKVYIKGITQ